MLSVGQQFPSYKLTACMSATKDLDKAFTELTEKDFDGKWKVYFFWPKDFTFICPTEIVGFGELNQEFADRDCQLIGISTDSDFVHHAWRTHHEDLTNSPFPWLSDINKSLSLATGVLDEKAGIAQRATFIVDPSNTIYYASMHFDKVGRNPEEVLRVLDALQTDELCPCNWNKGEDHLKVG